MDAAPIREARANAIHGLIERALRGDDEAQAEASRAAAEGHTTDGVRRWIEEASEAADAADEAEDADEASEQRANARRAYQRAAALLVRQMNRAAIAQIR